MTGTHRMIHSTDSTTVADLLERILDKGVVISGDIRIKLVEVELLTLEIRLLICSVDKAVEMGLDWWHGNPAFDTHARAGHSQQEEMVRIGQRLKELEERLACPAPAAECPPAPKRYRRRKSPASASVPNEAE